MQKIPKEEIDQLVKKYTSKLEKNISQDVKFPKKSSEFSQEYEKFREEELSKTQSKYEKFAKFAGKIIKTKPSDKLLPKIKESLKVDHLDLTPGEVSSFATFYPILIGIIAILIAVIAYLYDYVMISFFMGLIFLIGLLLITPLTKIPIGIADRWRVKAGDQIILCVLYMVIYMRHTSNLENAIKFASDHVGGPIALDLRKVFWDVEIGKYATIKESLDNYLMLWRENNLSFVNSIHLIESSLYEPGEERRLILLDKALKTVLDGIYDNMLHYAHDLKNPITMLHMLGIILPILGLVIFPLLGAFMGGLIKWYHLAFLYNLLLPLLVYNIGMNILSKRPSGYSETILGFKEQKGSLFFPLVIIIFGLILTLFPFIAYYSNISLPDFMGMPFFDFEIGRFDETLFGPYGIGALLFSLFLPLSLAIGIGLFFKMKSKGYLKIKNETKKLEKEFSSSLFQLGNRIGDGIPAESAFKDVSETMQGTPTGNLFSRIHTNLVKLGMSLKAAIFDKKRGAIKDYPSPLVESSMEVLIESAKKGPKIVSQSLISISNYVNSVHAVSERLKDLLADIISSMKSQINFMAPVIAGIVVGIASMIVTVISQLGNLIQNISTTNQDTGQNLMQLQDMFSKTETIPSYFFQLIVGVYVIQIIYILTVLASNIEYGADKVSEQDSLGKNLIKSGILYVIVSLIVILLFNKLAMTVLDTIV